MDDDRAQGAETPSTSEPSTTTGTTAKPGKSRKRMSRTWDRGKRPGQTAIEQRVSYVASLYLRGYPTRDIYGKCQQAAEKEHAARAAWIAAGSPADSEPTRVWDAGVPTSRTVDGYIKRAKGEYVRAAQEARGAPAAIVGQIIARNNLIFKRAIKTDNLAAAVRCNETLLDIFGLKGAIKLEVFGPAGGPIPVEATHTERPTASTTEQARAVELSDMLMRAVRARAAAIGAPVAHGVAGLMASPQRGGDEN